MGQVFFTFSHSVLMKLLHYLVLLPVFSVCAQDFSNRGKDFWVGYGDHIGMTGPSGGTQDIYLYLTSSVNANVKIFLDRMQHLFYTGIVIANQNPPTSNDP